MRRATSIIASVVALLAGAAAYGQEASTGPDPELLRLQATEARMQALVQLKVRADRAEAQRAKAEWAEDGQRMKEKQEWAEDGQRMKEKQEWAEDGKRMNAKREWAEDGQRMQAKGERVRDGKNLQAQDAKAEWAAQGRAQQNWTRSVEFWADEDNAMLRFANAHPYSPLGLLIRDLEDAVADDDQQRAEQLLEQARKVFERT